MSIDIITYKKSDGSLPAYVDYCIEDKKKRGFDILPITPDDYECPPCHAGYKHFRDITMPKLGSTKLKGLFICEGDVIINEGFNVDNIDTPNFPVWYGYKKVLSNYIVGNFLLWIPKSFYDIIDNEIKKKKGRLIYSDRFFTQLVDKNILKLHHRSIADEIQHYSNVLGAVRKSKLVL